MTAQLFMKTNMIDKKPAPVACVKCGYTWTPRVANPKACPNCKQYQVKFKKS